MRIGLSWWLAVPLLAGCNQTARTGSSPGPAPAPTANATIRFEDVTARSGIRFKHFAGAQGKWLMPESVGPGGAFLDYDRDGNLDVLCIDGAAWDGRNPKATPRLFRNTGNGTFADTTLAAGLAFSVYGMGCAVGDYDGDGWDDVLITCLGPNRLLRNNRGKFVDVTAQSGLGKADKWDWHTGAAWVDYDRDGDLDLFVCRYVEWSPKKGIRCDSGAGHRTYCGPNQYQTVSSRLYRNQGGVFADVSQATGIDKALGKGLGILPLDENGDGWIDLIVSNDTTPTHLFRSVAGTREGERRFEEVALETGIAVSPEGKPRSGMGIDVADVTNDGKQYLAIGNFDKEGVALFEQMGATYTDQAVSRGASAPTMRKVTFGLSFLDADRDGWQDLFTYNGNVSPFASETGDGAVFKQTPVLLRNQNGQLSAIQPDPADPLNSPQVGRGCAVGDFDNDGRPDLLLFENQGTVRLLRNATSDAHHWLGLALKGKGKNRNAFGAVVFLTAGGKTQRRWVRSGGSYLCESDHRALFGLGGTPSIEKVEVLWPSGTRTDVPVTAIDRYLDVQEP